MNNCRVSPSNILRICQRCCSIRQSAGMASIQASEDLPRITTPQKMLARLQKVRAKQRERVRPSKKSKMKSPLVISCKRNTFNHHLGQSYSDFGPRALASSGWKHPKSVGDHFTLLPHSKNPALLSEEEDVSFEKLHLNDSIVEALNALGFTTPTCIQRRAIPAIMHGHSTLCAAETGSGKTMAYLLPALDMLLRRHQGQVPESEEKINSPSIIILTPARELADQTMRMIEMLQEHIDFTAYSVCGGRGTKARLRWPIKRPMDILVATPGILRELLIAGQIKWSSLQQVILDEADTLLDDSFLDLVDSVLHRLRIPTISSDEGGASPTGYVAGVQFVLVSATMPRSLEENIGTYVPVNNLTKVTTSGLHRLMPHIPQKFVRLNATRRTEELVKLVSAEVSRAEGRLLIFCNKSSTCFYLGHVLFEQLGLTPAMLNGEMREKDRRGVFEKFNDGSHKVMVATDIASRGLNTVGVRHVLNYDFPLFMSDYIHRVGRVGRVGSTQSGLSTSFILKSWDVELLWQIETAARKSSELHNVNANIKRKLIGNHEKQQSTRRK